MTLATPARSRFSYLWAVPKPSKICHNPPGMSITLTPTFHMVNVTSIFKLNVVSFRSNFPCYHLGFLQMNRIGKMSIIANFACQYFYIFLLYFHYMFLVNAKLDVNGNKKITFQGWRHRCSSSFLMAQIEQN